MKVKKLQSQVLLIIDDILIREGLCMLLQELDCVAQTFGNLKNWQKDLTAINNFPQLIIADNILENNLSGKYLISKIRVHIHEHIPAIILAYDDEYVEINIHLDNTIVISGMLELERFRAVISKLLNNEIDLL